MSNNHITYFDERDTNRVYDAVGEMTDGDILDINVPVRDGRTKRLGYDIVKKFGRGFFVATVLSQESDQRGLAVWRVAA